MAVETSLLTAPSPSLDPRWGEQLSQREKSLEEQRGALAQALARLRAVHQAAHDRRAQDQEAVRRENGRLQAALADREGELAELRRRLEASEKHVAEARAEAGHATELARLQQELTARSEAALREQCQELERLIDELMQPGAMPAVSCPEVELPEPASAAPPAPADEAGATRQQPAELLALRELAAAQAQEVEQLQEEVDRLRRQLGEKDQLVERPRPPVPAPAAAGTDDFATYEQELVAYHRQLGEERRHLDDQIRELEAHNESLRARVRQAEIELASRRASLDHLCAQSRIDKAFVGVSIRENPVPVLQVGDPEPGLALPGEPCALAESQE